jgi:tetratricopeptide (TPR) repeat protein
VFFFIAFFFATLAPTSNLAILIGTIMAERFLYLPSIGFAGCLVWAVYTVCRRFPRVAPAALALVSVAFAARTYTRNFDWFDDLSLWTSAAQASPASYKPHTLLAGYYSVAASEPKLDTAIAEADRSLAIVDPLSDQRNVFLAYLSAGLCYRMKGDTLAPPLSDYWFQKSLAALLRGEKIDLANNQYAQRYNLSRGMRLVDSGWFQLYLELGRTYLRLSDPRQALAAFQYGRTLQLDPDLFQEMSAAYRALGDPQQAAITLMEGLVVDASRTQFAAELVDLYQKTEPRTCAIRNVAGSVSLNLDCPLVHSQLCTASRNVALLYHQKGQDPMAATTIRAAVHDLGCPVELFR